MYKEFHDLKKAEHIQNVGSIFVICGVPILAFFTFADYSIVGLKDTIGWRCLGTIPMLAFIFIRLHSIIFHRRTNPGVLQWAGVSIILGITIMMAASFFKAVVNISNINTIGLTGTVAGALLGVFSVGLLRGIDSRVASASIILPYLIMSILLVFQENISFEQWVFVGNVIVAIILVVIVIWQSEKSDDDKLHMLYELQQEQKNLEKVVATRTKDLEILIQELHHRVRNNLQIILSVINLYENEYQKGSCNYRLQMIQKVVYIIEYIHHLTHYDQIEEKVSMESFLNEICTYTYLPDEPVVIVKVIEEIMINTDIAIIIGFICVHFISKAVGNCFISFKPDKDGAFLSLDFKTNKQIFTDDNDITGLLTEHINAKIQKEVVEGKNIIKIWIPLEI